MFPSNTTNKGITLIHFYVDHPHLICLIWFVAGFTLGNSPNIVFNVSEQLYVLEHNLDFNVLYLSLVFSEKSPKFLSYVYIHYLDISLQMSRICGLISTYTLERAWAMRHMPRACGFGLLCLSLTHMHKIVVE